MSSNIDQRKKPTVVTPPPVKKICKHEVFLQELIDQQKKTPPPVKKICKHEVFLQELIDQRKKPVVVTPPSEVFLQDNHDCIPSYVKLLSWTWIYKRRHDFCKYTPVSDLPLALRNFDIKEYRGREMRLPRLKKIDGKETHVYEYMEYESSCSVHWSCDLCGLPLCIDPDEYIQKEVLSCTPVRNKDLAKVPPLWDGADYMFHYLLKEHPDLQLEDDDIKAMKNRYKEDDFGGKAWSVFCEEVQSYENSDDIVKILKDKLDVSI